jgi:Na+-transporting methylmalonyl-CoA/oxaloacetate decarboxylase gamma subunit
MIPTLAAALPDAPSLANNLQYQITGILVVLTTLGGLALIVWLAGKFFILRDRKPVAAAKIVAAEVEPIPGAVHAVIAAAVATVLADRQFIIHGVRTADPRANMAWGAEGRRSIYASKNLR